jgi:hypothetical protein
LSVPFDKIVVLFSLVLAMTQFAADSKLHSVNSDDDKPSVSAPATEPVAPASEPNKTAEEIIGESALLRSKLEKFGGKKTLSALKKIE